MITTHQGFDVNLYGPTASQPTIAFHDKDHPLVALQKTIFPLKADYLNQFSIDLSIDDARLFQDDVSFLMAKNWIVDYYCITDKGLQNQWILKYGFPAWTASNCEYLLFGSVVQNCSLIQSAGFPAFGNETEESLIISNYVNDKMGYLHMNRPCTAQDFFDLILEEIDLGNRYEKLRNFTSG